VRFGNEINLHHPYYGRMNEENLRLILGLKLRQYRQKKDFSLKELSTKTGVSVSYLNEIEKGKKYPKGDKIIALAKALDVDYDELVSLKLDANLAQLGDFLSTNMLQKLPLDVFGIDSTDLMSLMADTPDKFGALISTLLEFARMYDVKLEQFFFTVMRSYLEKHHNYFDDLENEAQKLSAKFFDNEDGLPEMSEIQRVLKEEFSYSIDFKTIAESEELSRYRTVYLPEHKTLLVNSGLTSDQQRFALAKELGYAWLDIEHRALTSSWLEVTSFEHVFNNFQASYVGGALLMPKDEMLADIRALFNRKVWEPDALQQMLDKYQATPEMMFYRWTELLPTFMGLKQIYFLRFFNDDEEERYHLTKEMHFSRLHSPHGLEFNEHYCRRWITLKALMQMKDQKSDPPDPNEVFIGAQRSKFWNTDNEYLNLSLSRSLSLKPETNSCVTIGFALNKETKSAIKFWNDAAVSVREVGETCERCGIENCDVRAIRPKIHEREQKFEESKRALVELREKYEEG